MKKFIKHNFPTALRVLVITYFVFAAIHLTIVITLTLARDDIDYMNPAEFLGISLIRPEYSNSKTALIVGWAILMLVYCTIFFVHRRYNLYIRIIKESTVTKVITKNAVRLHTSMKRTRERFQNEIKE